MEQKTTELWQRFSESLRRFILNKVKNDALADDLLQETFSYTAAKTRVARARHKLGDLLMNCCHYEFDKYGTVIGYHPIHCCCCNQHK